VTERLDGNQEPELRGLFTTTAAAALRSVVEAVERSEPTPTRTTHKRLWTGSQAPTLAGQ